MKGRPDAGPAVTPGRKPAPAAAAAAADVRERRFAASCIDPGAKGGAQEASEAKACGGTGGAPVGAGAGGGRPGGPARDPGASRRVGGGPAGLPEVEELDLAAYLPGGEGPAHARRAERPALLADVAGREGAAVPVAVLCFDQGTALADVSTPAGGRIELVDRGRADGSVVDLYPARADLRRFAGARLERFAGVRRVLREDAGLVGAALARAEPGRRAEIVATLRAAGAALEAGPSLRFVLNWETDANDVDVPIDDAEGGHASFEAPALPGGGGELDADVTTGYGPECFIVRQGRGARSSLYTLRAHDDSRGPIGLRHGQARDRRARRPGRARLRRPALRRDGRRRL